MSSFLPAILGDTYVFSTEILLIFVAHFLFIFAITLPFDARDIQIDNRNTIVTFPHLIGVKATNILSILSLTIFSWVICQTSSSWHIALFSIFTAGIIINASPDKKDYYFTLFLDGTIMVYAITLLILCK